MGRIKKINELKLTKSEFLIYLTLKKQGNMTKKELINKLELDAKTVKNTMRKFKKYGIIIVYPNLNDMRTFYIALNPRTKEVIKNGSSRVSENSNRKEPKNC